jgi:hypothetical protein
MKRNRDPCYVDSGLTGYGTANVPAYTIIQREGVNNSRCLMCQYEMRAVFKRIDNDDA